MRNMLMAIVGALIVCGCGSSLQAETQTLTGEVISVWCYVQNKQNVGRAGSLCALADVKWEGNPPGILTADGKVYQLAGPIVADNNAKVVPQLGHTVSVTGTVVEKNGIRVLSTSELKPVSQ